MSRIIWRMCWLLGLVLAAGCAGPLAGLGKNETDRAIESAASDSSFPNAAEAGISSGSL